MRIKTLIVYFFLIFALTANAQTLSPAMEKAISACQKLSKALEDRSSDPLKAANKVLKAADIVDYKDIALMKGKDLDINGHFLFDEEFIDSLIVNRKFLEFSRKYAENRSRASTSVKGRIKMTTKALKAGKSATWKTTNGGSAEFAVIAEPWGLLTMTISDNKGNVLYAETHKNKQGELMRKVQLKLPEGKKTTLCIEIINHSKKDTSFALLSN